MEKCGKRNKVIIRKECFTVDNMSKYTFFFRANSPFSNFYKCKFIDERIEFNCMEQYMMYHKAFYFQDYNISKLILKTPYNPKEYKALGRKVKGFNDKDWDMYKKECVYLGCYSKFTQNKELLDKLLATKGTELVEASPYDRIWGCGLSEDDARIQDKKNWTGLNLLGEILTELRDNLLEDK